MEKFDVVVAGAGTAGCLTAKTTAKTGLKTCLVDFKKREDIGKKICGDAIGKHHFDNLGLKTPTGDEVERVMEGVEIYSPDVQTSYVVKGEQLYGYILNRYQFGQRLVKEAQDNGAILYDSTQVLEPIINQGSICGITVKNKKTGEKKELRSSFVVEATGFFAAIRKKLTEDLGIDTKVENKDVEACYREIRLLKKQLSNPGLCQIFITQKATPGGYYWIFPEGGNKVNVGLGVSMSEGFPNPRNQLYKHVLSQPMFEGSSIINKGAWYVPTRRPLDCMVGNGILVVGDAACQVNPIHGGGIGPSMIGGQLAGETIGKALEKGDLSREGLWDYNVQYIRNYGAKQAGLEVFRILLQNMDDEELNFGMSHRLLTEEDVLQASLGKDVHFTISEKMKRAFRGLKKISVLKKLRTAADYMNNIKAWYKSYPEVTQDFKYWKIKTKEMFQQAIAELER